MGYYNYDMLVASFDLLCKSADMPQLANQHGRLLSLAMKAKVNVTTHTFAALSIQWQIRMSAEVTFT